LTLVKVHARCRGGALGLAIATVVYRIESKGAALSTEQSPTIPRPTVTVGRRFAVHICSARGRRSWAATGSECLPAPVHNPLDARIDARRNH